MEVSPSFWEKEVFYAKVDLLVVGAGIVGLTTAINFKKDNPKLTVRIIDASIFPKGASTRNAGFACFGSMTELLADIEENGEDACIGLVKKRWKGLQALRQLVGDENMEYQQLGGNEIFLRSEEASYQKVISEIDRMNQRLSTVVNDKTTFSTSKKTYGIKSLSGMIHNSLEGQLHPGKMIYALIQIAEKLGVIINRGIILKRFESDNDDVVCQLNNNQSIKASQLLIATNGFSSDIIDGLDLKPARNQVILTKPISSLSIKGCFHYDQGYVYFRNVGQRLLLGGGRHWDMQTAETSSYGENKFIQAKLMEFMKNFLIDDGEIQIEHCWSGILGVGEKKTPIVKYVAPNVAIAIRMGGMGVAIGAGVGQQAAELLSNN